MAKEIQLTQGKVAIVDDEDFERLSQFKWNAARTRVSGIHYAIRSGPHVNGKQKTIRLHREVCFAKPGQLLDHINGDTLDCRKVNLRFVTRTQNNRNRSLHRNNESGAKGVTFHKRKQKWQARIMCNRKSISLGYFSTKEEAARAYELAALQYHGIYARRALDILASIGDGL